MSQQLHFAISHVIESLRPRSPGVNCQFRMEVEGSCIHADQLSALQQMIERLSAACTQAVEKELNSPLPAAAMPVVGDDTSAAGVRFQQGVSSEPPASQPGPARRAFELQLEYAQELAKDCDGAELDLVDTLARLRFAKVPGDLSITEAEHLIDVLHELRSGSIDLSSLLQPEI